MPSSRSSWSAITKSSTSAAGSALPNTSASIWWNCRNRPFCGRSYRNSGPLVASFIGACCRQPLVMNARAIPAVDASWPMRLFDTIAEMGHEQLVVCHDTASGYRGIIAIHDTNLVTVQPVFQSEVAQKVM